ncbi:zinc finger domain-containing protein [Streptomyces sp. NPDC055722]
MNKAKTPWPSSYQYAMANPCPTCKAQPGVECDAPRKQAEQERLGSDPNDRLHATRQARGRTHRAQDVARAPWVEDRIPGQRYDSLGTAAPVVSAVDQAVQARIAAARYKRAQRSQQRAELDEARQHGLQARHAAKLKRQTQRGDEPA